MGDNDFLYHLWGAVESPILGTDVENAQLYSVCDPVRDRLLALFANALNYELAHHITTPRATSPWAIARTGTALATVNPVADVCWDAPTRGFLREAKFGFPLLALYRGREENEDDTLETERIRCTWGLHYILGPLTPEDARRLKAVLVFAHRLFKGVIKRRGHKAYESGALQFGEGKGDLSEVKITSCVYEPAAFGEQETGQRMYAAHMTLETCELESPIEGAEATDFVGVSVHAAVGGPEGLLPGRFELDTSVPQQDPKGIPYP